MFRRILKALFGGPRETTTPVAIVTGPVIWQALCEQLCPGDPSLFGDVQHSITDPVAYLEKFEFTLAERGIEKVSGVKPWLALVDGLIAREYLAEFDRKIEAIDLASLLEETHIGAAHNVRFSALMNSIKTGDGLLREAAAELGRYALGLLYFDIGSDSYPLMPVPLAKVPEIRRLTQALNKQVHVY